MQSTTVHLFLVIRDYIYYNLQTPFLTIFGRGIQGVSREPPEKEADPWGKCQLYSSTIASPKSEIAPSANFDVAESSAILRNIVYTID